MKKWIHAAVKPWKVKYEVHWLSPDGKDCLLAGSNSLDEAVRLGENQADQLFVSPFETDNRKYLFLKEMYIYDKENDRVVDTDLDEYTDNLMSELDSRMKAKKSVNSSTDADGWERERSAELETTFHIKEFRDGSATIQEYDNDGDWGYSLVIRSAGNQRIEKSFRQTELARVKAWADKKIAEIEAGDKGKSFYNVSYWLQDGTQDGITLPILNEANAYDEIEDALIERYGDNYGGIADYVRIDDDAE